MPGGWRRPSGSRRAILTVTSAVTGSGTACSFLCRRQSRPAGGCLRTKTITMAGMTRKRSPGSPSHQTRAPASTGPMAYPRLPPTTKYEVICPRFSLVQSRLTMLKGGRVEAGMAERSKDGKGHDQVVVLCNAHEGDEDGADEEADADADGEPLLIREPADDRLGEGRGDVIRCDKEPGSKVGVAVLGDEERQDGREHRHVDVGDHVGRSKPGDGIFHAAGRGYAIRFSRRISTSISCTSLVWKAKVRFIGNAPPIFSVISAFCAV